MTRLSYMCPDCAAEDAVIRDGCFEVAHDPTCPVLTNPRLAYLAEQDVIAAACLVEQCRGMAADYGSVPVLHVASSG